MTVIQAVVELVLFTVFLSVITAVCIACQFALGDAFMVLCLAGCSYAITTFNRDDPTNFTDKHL